MVLEVSLVDLVANNPVNPGTTRPACFNASTSSSLPSSTCSLTIVLSSNQSPSSGGGHYYAILIVVVMVLLYDHMAFELRERGWSSKSLEAGAMKLQKTVGNDKVLAN